MNIEDYISTGIIDSYVLGSVSSQEKKEVECLANIYPELQDVIIEKQRILEQVVLANSITPPAYLKDKIFKTVSKLNVVSEEKTTIKPLYKKNNSLAIAVAIILLFTVSFVSYTLYNKKSQLLNAKKEISSLLDKNRSIKEELSFYRDINTTKVELVGTGNEINLKVNLFWNTKTETVLAYGNLLPDLPTEKDYQLWAIVDEKPVSLGILGRTDVTKVQLELQELQNVEAFAVTIENLGGSESPNLEALQVIGEV